MNKPKAPWYFSVTTFIIAFLCVGPFALPLLWLNPHFTKKSKIITTIIVIIVSYLLGLLLTYSIKSIAQYYGLIFGS